MAAAWSASPTAMVLTASPCSRRTERSWYGPPTATPRSRTKPTSLLRTGCRRGREALALFRFKFLDPQRLVDPVICGTDVFCAGRQVVAFDVGFFAVHQVQVGHGVVVVGAKLNGLVEAVHAFLDHRHILGFQFAADLILLRISWVKKLFRPHAEHGAGLHARLVALGPIDHADGIVGLDR